MDIVPATGFGGIGGALPHDVSEHDRILLDEAAASAASTRSWPRTASLAVTRSMRSSPSPRRDVDLIVVGSRGHGTISRRPAGQRLTRSTGRGKTARADRSCGTRACTNATAPLSVRSAHASRFPSPWLAFRARGIALDSVRWRWSAPWPPMSSTTPPRKRCRNQTIGLDVVSLLLVAAELPRSHPRHPRPPRRRSTRTASTSASSPATAPSPCVGRRSRCLMGRRLVVPPPPGSVVVPQLRES